MNVCSSKIPSKTIAVTRSAFTVYLYIRKFGKRFTKYLFFPVKSEASAAINRPINRKLIMKLRPDIWGRPINPVLNLNKWVIT